MIRSGRSQSFEQAGIRQCQLSRQSNGGESLTLALAADAPAFARDEWVTIQRNAKNWFHGRAVTAQRDYSGRAEDMTVELVGPWCEFSERTFICSWNDGSGGEQMVPRGFIGLGGSSGSRGNQMSVGDWVQELAERVQTVARQQAGGSDTFWLGTIACPVDAPVQKFADGTFESALQKVTEFVPNLVTSWDHSAMLPTLMVQRAGELPAFSLALGNRGVPGKRGGVQAFAPQRARMTPAGVCIVLRKQTEREKEDGSKVFDTSWRTLAYPSAVRPGWRNVLTFTEDDSQDAEEARWEFPADLAREYFEHLGAATWQGSVTWHGEDVLDELTPGRVLNVTGGNVDFETMRAVIFSVTHDVMTGQSTAEFGPPDSLGFDSFRQWLAWQRRRKAGLDVDEHHIDEMKDAESGEETYGFGDNERPARGAGAPYEIAWCDTVKGPMTGQFRVKNARPVGA